MKLNSKEREILAELARDYPEIQQKLKPRLPKLLRKRGRPRLSVDWTQAQVLREQGLTYQQIAEELGVSVGSVYSRLKMMRVSLLT